MTIDATIDVQRLLTEGETPLWAQRVAVGDREPPANSQRISMIVAFALFSLFAGIYLSQQFIALAPFIEGALPTALGGLWVSLALGLFTISRWAWRTGFAPTAPTAIQLITNQRLIGATEDYEIDQETPISDIGDLQAAEKPAAFYVMHAAPQDDEVAFFFYRTPHLDDARRLLTALGR